METVTGISRPDSRLKPSTISRRLRKRIKHLEKTRLYLITEKGTRIRFKLTLFGKNTNNPIKRLTRILAERFGREIISKEHIIKLTESGTLAFPDYYLLRSATRTFKVKQLPSNFPTRERK